MEAVSKDIFLVSAIVQCCEVCPLVGLLVMVTSRWEVCGRIEGRSSKLRELQEDSG